METIKPPQLNSTKLFLRANPPPSEKPPSQQDSIAKKYAAFNLFTNHNSQPKDIAHQLNIPIQTIQNWANQECWLLERNAAQLGIQTPLGTLSKNHSQLAREIPNFLYRKITHCIEHLDPMDPTEDQFLPLMTAMLRFYSQFEKLTGLDMSRRLVEAHATATVKAETEPKEPRNITPKQIEGALHDIPLI